MKVISNHKTKFIVIFVLLLALLMATPAALADHPDDGGEGEESTPLHRDDPSGPLVIHDAATADMVVSGGPSAKVIKNLANTSRGERLVRDATTDVWAHNGYGYTGTFSSPCGGDPNAGIWIWDVHNHNHVSFVGIIPSPAGSRSNDVKVATMNSGDILVHSNEVCGAGGVGGFEVYNVNDPTNPVHLAHVQVDEINPITDALFGGLSDNGVHNLFLFTQGNKDYVAAQSEGAFDGFQIFDITDPANPSLVSGWGAEEVFDPGVGDLTDLSDPNQVNRVLNAALWLLSGFGASANRFLHDFTITPDGTKAYLAHWDAGLILLDISDVSHPQLVSVALDQANGSPGDGEVNSHSVWPSEDGRIVVEGEEDFSAWEALIPPSNLTLDSSVPGDPTIPATAVSTTVGDDFEANQVGNSGTVDGSSVNVTGGPLAGNTYAAIELATAAGSPTFADTGSISAGLVFIGRACPGDPILNTGAFNPADVAVVRRGACFFEDKANTAASLGASAVVIANNQASTPWSGLRIWDYSDPANPVLASTFDTVCSASTAPGGNCDPAGTYSSHNVVVETTDDGQVKAYVSWYWNGMLILDVTDPYNPVEIARFFDNTPEFLAGNGGNPHDFWGVYKEVGSPWVYGSDRNGGLYSFKEFGSGSAKQGQ